MLTFATRIGAVRAALAIATALGLPRLLTPAEVTRVGSGPFAPLHRIRLYCRPREILEGPLAGRWAITVRIDDEQIAALLGRSIAVPATYDGVSVPGGAGTFTVPQLADWSEPSVDSDGVEAAL